MASPITGSSRSVRVAGTVDAGRCGCVAASTMPAYPVSPCSTGACCPATALLGVRTDCLPPSSPSRAVALLASVAAIATAVRNRNQQSVLLVLQEAPRLVHLDGESVGVLVRGIMYLKSVAQRCGLGTAWTSQHCFVHRFMVCVMGIVCAAIALYQVTITTTNCFSSSVKAQSRNLSHALSRVGLDNWLTWPHLGRMLSLYAYKKANETTVELSSACPVHKQIETTVRSN